MLFVGEFIRRFADPFYNPSGMGDFITNLVNLWNGLSQSLREAIIGGTIATVIAAFIIGTVTGFWKFVAAIIKKLVGRKKSEPSLTAPSSTPASPSIAVAPAQPAPPTTSTPPADDAGYLSDDQKALWQFIQDHFDISELSTDLCVPLNLKPEDVLAGNTLREKSLALVTYCRRRNTVQQLRDAVQRARPDQPALPKATRSSAQRFAGAYIERGIEADVQKVLSSSNSVAAIVGVSAPGGIGKSTLASVVAERVRDQFERVVWQNCGESSDLDVINALLLALEVRIAGNEDEWQRLALLLAALAGRKALIVLDDVRAPNESLLQRLAPSAGCAVLATSRLALTTSPLPASHRFNLQAMTDGQARDLLIANLGLDVVQQEETVAGQLITRLKGNVLALDLATRRILLNKGMAHPIAVYLRRLDDRLPSVPGMAERGDVFTVFAESYAPLDAAMQRRFRRMAVFPSSGGTIAHLAAVWGEGEAQADVALMQLLNAGLVKPAENRDERYRLHDLQDEWALSLLREGGEEREARLAHAEFIIKLFDNHYTTDPAMLTQMLDEWDNLKAASDWAASAGDATTLARLATLSRNWQLNIFRNTGEWQGWLQKSLDIGVDDAWLKANTLQAIGDVQQFRDDRDAAIQSYTQALALFKQVGAKLGEAKTHRRMGHLFLSIDEIDIAAQHYHASLILCEKTGDQLNKAYAMRALGDIALRRNEREEAFKFFHDALALFIRVGDRLGEGNTYLSMAECFVENQQNLKARQMADLALDIYRKIEDTEGIANTHTLIGRASNSESAFKQAIELQTKIQNTSGIAEARLFLGKMLSSSGERDQALSLLRDAKATFTKHGNKRGLREADAALTDLGETV